MADKVIWKEYLPYNKKVVLRALVMYSKKTFYKFRQQEELYKARKMHGTQFLIDLYVLSEVYINHWPKYRITELREHVTRVLNNNPDERIRNEEAQHKKVDYSHL